MVRFQNEQHLSNNCKTICPYHGNVQDEDDEITYQILSN